jgi:hypothetical protein
MKNFILSYTQINESNDLDDLSSNIPRSTSLPTSLYERSSKSFDLGILDEDILYIYNYVKNGSTGYLELCHSELTHLPNWLTIVFGVLDIHKSNIEDIPDSLEITDSIYASDSKLKEFRRTETARSLSLDYSKITKLPDNLIVHGYLSVEGIQFEQFPKNLIKMEYFI